MSRLNLKGFHVQVVHFSGKMLRSREMKWFPTATQRVYTSGHLSLSFGNGCWSVETSCLYRKAPVINWGNPLICNSLFQSLKVPLLMNSELYIHCYLSKTLPFSWHWPQHFQSIYRNSVNYIVTLIISAVRNNTEEWVLCSTSEKRNLNVL